MVVTLVARVSIDGIFGTTVKNAVEVHLERNLMILSFFYGKKKDSLLSYVRKNHINAGPDRPK